MIRLLLAEDQALIRAALATLLELEEDLSVVAQAGRGDEVVPLALATRPDVALLDIEMPGLDGLAVAAALHAQLPACRTIILTTFGRPGYLRRALESHALGFLVKDAPPEDLARAIRAVAAGRRVVDPALAVSALAEGANPLTPRQGAILGLIADGKSPREIAEALSLSEGTVRNYLSEAIQRLGVRSSHEAARRAREHGWL